jgi:uncharacterized protein with FMN-binding domain
MGVTRRAVVTVSVTAGSLLLLANFHSSSGASNLTVGNAAGAAATTATTDVTSTASVGSPTTAGAPPPPTTPPSTAPPSTAPPTTGASTTPAPPRSVAPTSAPPPVATSVKARTVDGPVIGTPYGDVQVRVVLRASHIVDVQPLTLPTDRSRSRRISELAAPLLRTEVLQAQSANIDLLSGASYTSEGYAESLQGALDAARS